MDLYIRNIHGKQPDYLYLEGTLHHSAILEKVEVLEEGYIVVNGLALDLRGGLEEDVWHTATEYSADAPNSVPDHDDYSRVTLSATRDKSVLEILNIFDTGDSLPADVTREITTFPDYVQWPDTDPQAAQTISKQHTDNYTKADHRSSAVADLKRDLATVASNFDEGLSFHWPHLAAQTSDVSIGLSTDTSDERFAIKRFNNTANWGRLLIGYGWREVLKYENGDADAQTESALRELVSKVKADIPNSKHVRIWYLVHLVDIWAVYIADSETGRLIYTTSAAGSINEKIYDINTESDTGNTQLDEVAHKLAYKNIVTQFYNAALIHSTGL